MKHDLTSLNPKGHQASLLLALLQWCCINSLEFIYISVPDCIFSCSFPTLRGKKDIKFIRVLSGQIILAYSTVKVSLL